MAWPCFFRLANHASHLRKKPGRNYVRPSFTPSSPTPQLERNLQTQLHGAAAAGTDNRVGGSHVRRGAATAERLHRRIVQPEPVLPAVGIRKVRMIENVEELGAELGADFFAEMPVLGDRE